jgi:hypothetical protein
MPEKTVQDLIREEASKVGIPAELALAVAEQESGFNPTVFGPEIEVGGQKTRAIGTFQLLPQTARRLGVDPNHPVQNIQGGVKYLRELLDQNQGDLNKTLSVYGGVRDNTTYVPGVIGRMPKFRQTTAPAAAAPQPSRGGPPPAGRPSPLPGTPPPAPTGPGWMETLTKGLDPRNPEGRRNLAGTAGAVGAAYLTGGLSTVPGIVAATARVAAPIVGAAFGGAAAETGEQAVGNAPPSPSNVAWAGAEQGAMETAGGLIMWPVKAVGRRLIAPSVATSVRQHLSATMESASDAMRAIRTRTRRALNQESLRTTAAQAGIKAGTEASTDQISNQLARQPGGPPAPTVGRMANEVIQGPAKSVLDQAGQAVEEAAASGPMVNLGAVREKLQAVSQQMLPPGGAAPNPDTAFLTEAHRALMSPQDLAALQAVESSHPIKGLLGQLQNLGDEIDFAEAHRIKRLLDEAVNWDSPAKKLVQQATKGVRQVLRESMAGHAPYDEATKAYADLVPLFRKGLAPKLRKQIVENPELLVNSIKPNRPTEVQMIKDLLLTQAEKGGGGAEGQVAWDALRSEWTFEKVINGPVEGLSDRLAKLPAEFRSTFYDDAAGQQVLSNLEQIAAAYADAIKSGKIALSSEKLGTKVARTQIKEAGENQLEPIAQGMRDTRRTARDFSTSSLGSVHRFEATATDAIRAAILTPTSAWQNVALLRLMVHGPKVPELIQWASYSPVTTRALVKVFTSPLPGTALATLARMPGFLDLVDDPGDAQPGGPPPPVRAQGPGPRVGAGGGPPAPQR